MKQTNLIKRFVLTVLESLLWRMESRILIFGKHAMLNQSTLEIIFIYFQGCQCPSCVLLVQYLVLMSACVSRIFCIEPINNLRLNFDVKRKNSSSRSQTIELHYFCVVAGKELNCFDCDSRKDPRCHDPFNFTDHRSDMPPTRKCDGCCVKLVQHRGSCKGLHHFYNSTIFSFYCQLMKQSEELAQTRLTSTCSWWIMSV